ncbi:MAG: hypothetical protein JSS02_08650 [Planctomycetes bacterium]|nr:hypothetical protein [Planctomycetota bacterium]
MSTENTTSLTAMPLAIQQRLDAVDQALLGLLPRPERLAVVSQIEQRARELVASTSAVADKQSTATSATLAQVGMEANVSLPALHFLGAAAGGWNLAPPKQRSKLALWAGALGIVACILMVCLPVTYFAAVFLANDWGEGVSISLVGLHAAAMALGGIAAVAIGIIALVVLKRQKMQLAGYGWAISGLCTGSLPTLLGIGAVVLMGIQLGAAHYCSNTGAFVDGDSFVLPSVPPPEFQGVPNSRALQPAGYDAPPRSQGVPMYSDADKLIPTPGSCSLNPAPHDLEPRPQPVSLPETQPSTQPL